MLVHRRQDGLGCAPGAGLPGTDVHVAAETAHVRDPVASGGQRDGARHEQHVVDLGHRVEVARSQQGHVEVDASVAGRLLV